jgi:hypothetical protein
MGLITAALPTIGQPNSSEDPTVRAALAAIIAVLNGNIDTTNIATNGVASSDITPAAVTKAKLATDALGAFPQLAAGLTGLGIAFGLDSVNYGGGGTSISRSASYAALSGAPKFAAAIPLGVNTSGANPMRSIITSPATSTLLSFSLVHSQPAVVVGAGTYTTYWVVIG